MKVEDLPLASMSAVKARDRATWLSLFEEDAVVEDPVGTSGWDKTGEGQRGRRAIAGFYDMFSSMQRSMDFEVHYLVACASEAAAFVTMTSTMNDDTVHSKKMINIYKASPSGKIVSLRSFWKVPLR